MAQTIFVTFKITLSFIVLYKYKCDVVLNSIVKNQKERLRLSGKDCVTQFWIESYFAINTNKNFNYTNKQKQ